MLRPVFFVSLIFIMAIIILAVRLKILVEYNRNNSDDNLVISFFMLKGLIKYKYEAPVADFKNKGLRLKWISKYGKKEKRKKKKRSFINLRGLYERRKMIRSVFEKYLKGRAVLENLSIEIEYGSEDASCTGIITGLIWSAVGMLDVLFTNNFSILKKRIRVQPDFTRKVLIIDVYCIITTRIVNIIIMALQVLFDIISAKLIKKTDRWWYY